MAQLVEQRIRNAWVGGSSPPSGSKISKGEFGKNSPLFFSVILKMLLTTVGSADISGWYGYIQE